jgi:hypothetical protein
MFDPKQVDTLVATARETLRRQQEEMTPGEPENFYQDLIDEQNGEQEKVKVPENDYEIKNAPDSYEERPHIANKPSAEDYQEYPKIDEFDKPIFPGGPLQSQINSWKKQFTGYDIYVTEVAGEYFVFRTLNRFEYKQIVSLQNTDPLMREEIICETVTLWPAGYKWDSMATGKAGIPSTYSQIIMEKSGFTKDYAIQIL